MEAYELDQDKIISWAINFASYDELESVAINVDINILLMLY